MPTTSGLDAVKAIQSILKQFVGTVVVDGDVGKITCAALETLAEKADFERLQGQHSAPGPRTVKASFFAGPEDVSAFLHCKSLGGGDQHCFALGDNGVGAWGRDCTRQDQPLAALPREVWRALGKTDGARLAVTYQGHRVEGLLGDTMPAEGNIENGCGIDLNPAYALAFGVPLEQMNEHTLSDVTYEFI